MLNFFRNVFLNVCKMHWADVLIHLNAIEPYYSKWGPWASRKCHPCESQNRRLCWPTPGISCILTTPGDLQVDWSQGSIDLEIYTYTHRWKEMQQETQLKMSLWERHREVHLVQGNWGFKLQFLKKFLKAIVHIKGWRQGVKALWPATGIFSITPGLNLKIATEYSFIKKWFTLFMLMT